ncbi:DNA excision repair protein ERCC-1 [Chloropicon primus]|uniref:DNA excision repair protein ERCC-1 n=1 Tax=Chloropicon primus TaxID=1764295 RepID=A0A5B8MVN5_9CHLO|nr:DNA excision repair protein ERCC-1 [Chloropicon primus]UPR03821.1 DNA excision repair protein ERCC-1 [Chloropicon primus]|mmetsp:Transcript_7284/g.21143  ORF Transcript_7284/g.21143 Transcript_7284/m.21143 type:complete len:275 (+) Transcript_7284:166-990(+)|eukprot:QDZ24613.1 DNA excision repair protein ERCC-1 [Chloropicon primus]
MVSRKDARKGWVKAKNANATTGNPSLAVWVSKRQTGNPLLRFIKNVRWEYADDLVPDYQMGPSCVALFLSLKYHLLHPQYIHLRIRELQRAFRLRVLLVHVDVDDPVKPLAAITKLACLSDLTLFCAWSYEECARYIETFKTYETKPHDLLLGNKTNVPTEDYTTRVTQALTQIRGVNRTDVLTLTAAFHTLKDILQLTEEDLSGCPGLGPTKVKRLYDAFHTDFYPTAGAKGATTTEKRKPTSGEASSGASGNKGQGPSKRRREDQGPSSEQK